MPPPPLPQDGALAPRRAAPRRDPPRPAPAREERSCQEIHRPREAALALPALPRQDSAPPVAVPRRPHQDQDSPPKRAPITTAGCRAFTPELCSIAWPVKFKPDLPPRYDGTADPTEFLQLYELSIEAANGDEKVMENWFPMALKDGARSWLLNLQHGSISS